MHQLNNTIQQCIITSWFFAWFLITAMPVIHANSSTTLQHSNHCPVASMEMFQNDSMQHSNKAKAKESKKFYHCPLCHCACLIFASYPAVFASQFLYSSPLIEQQHNFTSIATFFKQPRAPPYFL